MLTSPHRSTQQSRNNMQRDILVVYARQVIDPSETTKGKEHVQVVVRGNSPATGGCVTGPNALHLAMENEIGIVSKVIVYHLPSTVLAWLFPMRNLVTRRPYLPVVLVVDIERVRTCRCVR